MSTYPGDDPQPHDDQSRAGQHDDTEPTQPVGYWERRAAEQSQAAQQGQPAQPEQPTYDQSSYGQSSYDQSSYGQGSYGQSPYGQPSYGQASYGQPAQPAYGASPYAGGYPPAAGFPGYAPRDHPQSTMAMILGLVSLVGGMICGLPLLAAPFAWVVGGRAVKEIRASQGQLGGEGMARAGQVMGIVGTVLLVLAIIGIVLLVVLAVAGSSGSSGYDYSNA